ncbi:MAG: hypothetical protein Q8S14_12135 [Algoriphagus sp.]|uniref:hypothetical protein n=1 Tax=Algoriphagus sp. TaxID=1872435 RepID=UPI00273008E4|nr:hypothetical protein [Algoriphagus sp.]MDP2040283.1 hypothetical protein [Algoriphagus sp.]MDP3472613.1 hypothetical protein [Algoriphagus sp.]
MKKQKTQKPLAEDWDLSEGMGILPSDISLTQNIGCVSERIKKPNQDRPKKENKA